MHSVIAALAKLDGIAQKQDLVALGITRSQLAAAVRVGTVFRVRQGWYAVRRLDPSLIRAIRVGGRLACVSAARHYGWATMQNPDLHVCLTENAARLRRPDEKRVRMPAAEADGVILHWVPPRRAAAGDRLITSRHETVLQIAKCQSPELAIAAYDSFLHLDPLGSRDLDSWLNELPGKVRLALPARTNRCHSFLESIGRVRLLDEGITGQHQVRILGVGRVDMLIAGWLVIEWDGLEHHDNGPAHDEDCRRDAMLAAQNYRCLRFSYNLVMYHWDVVIAAIRGALAAR